MSALELTDRITTASNATFLGRLGDIRVVYKPTRGEQPLWDFPDRTLARREVASYIVSEALGWDIVPRTWLGTGPFGDGMLQEWRTTDPDQRPVDLVPATARPEGWFRILDGVDPDDVPVSLVHENTPALRRMALFDILVNNADRKGDHVLAVPGGHRHGVDHGLTFHPDPRLRTVLWGWTGETLTEEEVDAVSGIRTALDAGLADRLSGYLSATEITAFARRCDDLLDAGAFPGPGGDMPAVPWPVF